MEFDDEEKAAAAIREMDGRLLWGRRVRMELDRSSRDFRPPRREREKERKKEKEEREKAALDNDLDSYMAKAK